MGRFFVKENKMDTPCLRNHTEFSYNEPKFVIWTKVLQKDNMKHHRTVNISKSVDSSTFRHSLLLLVCTCTAFREEESDLENIKLKK